MPLIQRRVMYPDKAMLHLVGLRGLRVSELTVLRTGDVTSIDEYSCLAKDDGTVRRMETTASALRAWLAIGRTVAVTEVFHQHRGNH